MKNFQISNYNIGMLYYFYTLLLIFINVIVFFLIRNGRLDADDLDMSYHTVFNLRQYHRILTSAFCHVDPIH